MWYDAWVKGVRRRPSVLDIKDLYMVGTSAEPLGTIRRKSKVVAKKTHRWSEVRGSEQRL